MRDPIVEFENFNRGFARRNPELLRLKIARMAASPFAFFRGTFHLFARDVLARQEEWVPLLSGGGAEMDLVGDIHSENYGTFKAADGQVHYDINDFDETTHGRPDFDVCRLATSLFLVSREHSDGLAEAVQVTLAGAATYAESVRRHLKKGADFDINETTAGTSTAVEELVRTAAAAKRPDFIGRLTESNQGQRRIVRSLNYFNLPAAEHEQALRLLADYVSRQAAAPTEDFYAVEDVCGRVAGIGSMGRFRYVVLVAGKGSREVRNVLLEFKEARPSAYDLYRQRETGPEALLARAERVISVQRQSQAASSPYLGFAVDGGMSFQVREVGPHDARLDLKAGGKGPAKLVKLAQIQAGLLARTHARAAARTVGVANALAEVSDVDRFSQRVLSLALAYADVVQHDWTRFVGQRGVLDNCEQWAEANS